MIIAQSTVSSLPQRHHASYPVAIAAMWNAMLPDYTIKLEVSVENIGNMFHFGLYAGEVPLPPAVLAGSLL